VYAFTDLALAAYCSRKLYYRRRETHDPPERDEQHELAFRYPELLDPNTDLTAEPIAVSPVAYRRNLGCTRARVGTDVFDALCDPPSRDIFLTGRQARGISHKVIDTPLAPSIVSAGEPPETGVWKPQTVRAVAAAKALAWERETPIERAFVEYSTHGVIREFELTSRRVGLYRRAVRTAASIDGPPPRTRNTDKCKTCEFRSECGVRTRSLRSLLG
jgi:CRISPR-associated exonuclease Cas4